MALIATFPAVTGHAEENEQREAPETIVITAEAPDELPGPNVRIIEVTESIEAGQTTVAEAVAASPGVSVQRRGSGFESSTVRIRGSSGEQVLVLRDGQPVGNSLTGLSDLSRISLRGVERIEIVFGPATALYGAGGAAGAINLISKNPEDLDRGDGGVSGRSSVEYGSFGEYRLGAELVAPLGPDDLSLSVDGVYAQNEYDYGYGGSSETRTNAGGWQGETQADYTRRLDNVALGLAGSLSHSDRGVPGTVEFPSDSARMVETAAGATLSVATGGAAGAAKTGAMPEPESMPDSSNRWGTASRLTWSRTERSYTDRDYPLGELSSESTLYRLDAGATARGPLREANLNLPASYVYEALQESELGERERHVIAFAPAYVMPPVPLGRSSLGWQVSARGELSGSAGETALLPSARTSVSWRAPGELFMASLGLGAGYRYPTFSELFWPSGAFAVGNAELQPELSRSMELELQFGRPDQHLIRLNSYATLYRDLIQWLPTPTGYWRPRNTGEAITLGSEAAYEMQTPIGLSPWTATGEVSGELLYARDLTEGPTYGMQLPYRPEQTGGLSASLSHLLGHRFGGSVQAVGRRPVTAQNTAWLDPYLAIDLYAAYAVVGTAMVIRGRVNNVLDRDFVETRFYPNPGREIVLSLEVSW